jgi:hypothetical protein
MSLISFDDNDDERIGASAKIRGCRVLQTSGLQVKNPQHRLGIRLFFLSGVGLKFLMKNDWGKAEIWF